MTADTRLRTGLAILTGLWVTTGSAIPIGYVVLRVVRSAAGGRLGPELLERPAVVLALLAGFSIAATIGGWAAGWVASERRWRLAAFLSLAHVGLWLLVGLAGSLAFPAWLLSALALSASAGSTLGIWARSRQAGSRSLAAASREP